MVFHQLAALGGTLPYGTLSPCWCVKYLEKNRTSFHDAHATSGTGGVRPRFRRTGSCKYPVRPVPYKSRPVVTQDNARPPISYRAASSRVTVLYQQHCVFRNPCTSRHNQNTERNAVWLFQTCVCIVHSLYCPCGRYRSLWTLQDASFLLLYISRLLCQVVLRSDALCTGAGASGGETG